MLGARAPPQREVIAKPEALGVDLSTFGCGFIVALKIEQSLQYDITLKFAYHIAAKKNLSERR